MLASLDWLRSLCPTDADAETIADALTARGLTVDSIERGGSALEIDVPANRPDCLGHLGLARELSAALGAPLAARETPSFGDGEIGVRVDIADPKLCGRYTAGLVRGVTIGSSPEWVVQRLEACGLRSINNVVDASNLVLLELGNPIHFFDRRQVRGDRIGIACALDGESFETLDGVERKLDADTLMIDDGEGHVALAGIMGGADSEIKDDTRDVLIEAAWFEPLSVRRSARRLQMKTDASHRFERGVDPEALPLAQDLAMRLLEQLAGGTRVDGLVDAHAGPQQPHNATLRSGQLERLLGYVPAEDEVSGALEALGLRPKSGGEGRYDVTIPSWRVDLGREADLVEEVARHLGYDRIPVEALAADAVADGTRPQAVIEERAREVLANLGFHEAVGYSMIGEGQDLPYLAESDANPIRLSNPIAESLAFLRRSVLPGLVQAVELNQRRGARDVRLFEVGRVFFPDPGSTLPREPLHAALAWSGAGHPRHWGCDVREVELYDMMGCVDRLIDAIAPGFETRREGDSRPGLRPGQSAIWRSPDGKTVAWAGGLHPDLQTDMPHDVFLAEIDLDLLAAAPTSVPQYRSLARLTPVTRDLAVVISADTAWASVVDALRGVSAPAPATVAAVDHYSGAPLADDEMSLTVRVTLHPDERTLTDAEIEGYREALINVLQGDLGLKLR
ncbi:MAG: phenylalanine--tRNA ligase subunit beta [bacterium]|nr:phenylalanine--tRNA ligase subunit beta [bacterium]